VFRVVNVNVPTFDAASPDVKRLEDALRRVFGEELLTEYLIKLEAEIGTRVNQSAINQALGSSGNQ
jgi:peptidyl-prolyl cis-trans isomerase D